MMYICIIDGLSLFDIKQSRPHQTKKGNIIYVDFVETEIELWDNPFWYCFAAMWCGKYIIKMWITIRDRDEEHKICKINEGKLPSWD